MRNHSFLYLLRPDGEEGELQRIAESNSIFPSLWKILFAKGCIASEDARRVLRGAARYAIEVNAEDAVQRFEHFKTWLIGRHTTEIADTAPELFDALLRYLDGATCHLRELIAEWSVGGGAPPVFCADFDEMVRPEEMTETFLRDQLASYARLWSDLEQLRSGSMVHAVEALLGFRSSNLRFTDWRAWSGLFGLALFEHDYFQKAFRKPFECAYADYHYDPLGVGDDLGGGVHRFRMNDRWGVCLIEESETRVLIAAEWDRVLRAGVEESQVVWVKRRERFGLAAVRGSNAGTLLVEPILDEVGHFENSVAPVRVGSKMGFLRNDGCWFLAPAWDRVWPFRHGYAVVEANDHLTYIDSQGLSITPARFDEAEHFNEHGIARVRKGPRYGLLRNTGEFAIDLLYSQIDWIESFQGWLCKRDNAFTLLRPDASRWIEGEWEQIDVWTPQQVIRVRRNGRFGLLDWHGRALIETVYESIEPLHLRVDFAEGPLFTARRAHRVGVIDSHAIQLVPFEFSRIEPFSLSGEDGETDPADDLLIVYSVPNRARPKAGIWDLRLRRLRAPCQYDRETLAQTLLLSR